MSVKVSKATLFRKDNCRLCHSLDLQSVFNLVPTPPANNFVTKDQLKEKEEKFPLELFFCKECKHLQLLDVVDPEILFRNYVYVSGTSSVFVQHFKTYAQEIISQFNLKKGCKVLEIGSNDGTLLRMFQNEGMEVLGVDPAIHLAKNATNLGIKTLPLFFNEFEAEKIFNEYGKFDLIIANNVFAHIDDLDSVTKGIKNLLKPDGIFVFEVSYLVDVYEKLLFDTIYHEHLCYHSVKPLKTFFKRFELELFRAQRVESHGGSLRGFVQSKEGRQPLDNSVEKLLQIEHSLELDQKVTFEKFARRINELKKNLHALLFDLKKQGKTISGFGAPAKATTLMHYFDIGSNFIDFIIDDNPLKQGLYTPGLHIPVETSSKLYESKPDYTIILAWNFSDSIIKNHKEYLNQGGQFILPLPELKVIHK